MPWKETSPMEQRFEFVLQWAKHESSMAELCRTYGISRKTGYQLVAQFQAEGLDGLKPHSRAPQHHPNAIAEDVCTAVVRAKAARWRSELGSQEAPAIACSTNRIASTSSGQWPARAERSWRGPG